MAFAKVTYTGNGATTNYTVSFPYLDQDHVLVYVNGVLKAETTDYTWSNSTTIQFNSAPANGATILIQRKSNQTSRLVDYQDGSTLTGDLLDTDANQSFFMAQEAIDKADDAIAAASGVSVPVLPISNGGTGASTAEGAFSNLFVDGSVSANKLASDAVTTAKIADSNVTYAKIQNVSAASRLIGRGSAGGAGVAEEISLGTGLSMSGTTLSATVTAGPTLGTPVASTSGTSIDFTSIPATAKQITVMFDGVSTNGTSSVRVQIGDSGGIENTGYAGSSDQIITGVNVATFSAGFDISDTHAAANTLSGRMTISLVNASTNTWAANWIIGTSNTASLYIGAGSKALSAALDRVRITTVNGTDAFDAGTINIAYL